MSATLVEGRHTDREAYLQPVVPLAVQFGANGHVDTSYANDDPVPRLIAAGWGAVLVEPVPGLAAALRSKYAGVERVRVVEAAACPAGQSTVPFYRVDFENTEHHGSQHADPRCADPRTNNASVSAFVLETGSLSRALSAPTLTGR